MSGRLEVVAVGARTPLGSAAESSAAAVRAGIASFAQFPFIMAGGDRVVVSADPELDPATEGRERLVPLIDSVLDEVLHKLTQGSAYRGPCRLLLALPEARPGFSDDDATWVADAAKSRLRAPFPHLEIAIAGRGHAGAIQAIQVAIQESTRSEDSLFLIVGADSYHHPHTFLWLEQERQFAQPGVRGGFLPGEGVGCLALTTARLQTALRLPSLASVGGVGTARESLLRTSETGSFGAAMTEAVLAATKGLRLPAERVDTLYSDINGERYRSEEWGFVAMNTPSLWKTLDYEMPSACWGDVGAAFGTLAAVLSVQSHQRRYARGVCSLVMAGSESGLRGAVLLRDARSA